MATWAASVILLAAILSLACAIFAWSCRPGNHRHLSLERRLRELESEQADLQDGWSKCLTALKRINQREVMRERRSAAKEPEKNQEETDEEWRDRMNREQLANRMRGQL